LAFFSSSEELLEAEPARAGAATTASSPTGTTAGVAASVSASLGVASVLFLGVVEAVAAASAVGLPE
jgi:hypothetical protein